MLLTRKQETIFENFLKTQGYVKTEKVFSYFDAKEEALNEIENYKNEIIETKEFKESNKGHMIVGDSYVSKVRKNPNSTEKEIKGAVGNAKNRQRLYKDSLELYKELKEKLRNKEFEYRRLLLEEKEIAEIKIDFGPYVRNATGIECINCGCLDAYEQVNPYTAEIEQRIEMITVCDKCASLIAEEI